ncbi:MAG: ATP synthase F1 subunit delta [Candidatus Omnitrophota bacterium]|nr:MAG: ATP synthase F1 subunit delta [Candidatus Omnitrophota bacterium]
MSKISEVYARALLKYGGDQSCASFIQELKNFYKVVESYPQMLRWFQFRSVPRWKKIELANHIGKSIKLDKRIMNFIRLLIIKNRLSFVTEIISDLEKIYSQQKVLKIKLESPVELDKKFMEEISNIIKDRLQRELQLYVVVNNDMLFGFRLYFDHKLYDLSLDEIFSRWKQGWRRLYV